MTDTTDSWPCRDCGPAATAAAEVREIAVAKEPLRITLPAASLEVDFQHPKEDVKHWVVLLRALDADGKPVRGTFARTCYQQAVPGHTHTRPGLEFVRPGCYTLLAWRDGLSWARSKPIQVERSKVANGGLLKLQPGGTIQGRIRLPQVSMVPVCVVATDSRGIGLEAEAKWTHEGYSFAVTDLWPETWTIAALDVDRQPIAQRTVTLKGTETLGIE